MPEILGDAGCYFDPEDVAGIVGVLQQFLRDPEQRRVWAEAAYERAQRFSWHACAEATFAFLADVAAGKGRSR